MAVRMHKNRSSAVIFSACVILALVGCSNPKQKEARYLKRGNEFFAQADYDKARIEYSNAQKMAPTDAEPFYRLGMINDAQGHLGDAYKDFSFAEQQDARYRPAILKLAEYYLAADRYHESETRLNGLLAENPEDLDARALFAGLLFHKKDYSDATKEANQALAKDPGNIVALSVLAGIQNNQGHIPEAIALVDKAIAYNPKNLSLLVFKAQLCRANNDSAGLAATYQAIFNLAPTDIRYRVQLAQLYMTNGQKDEAEKTLRDGVASLPKDWEMKHQLVLFLGEYRDANAAEKQIQEYISANPEDLAPQVWLTDLYLSHDQTDKALTFLNDIIARSPSKEQNLQALTALARIKYLKGDKDDAEKLANDIFAKNQNALDALFIKAHIEFDKGAYTQAVTDLRMITRDQPRASEAYKLLAKTFLAQGHANLAAETLGQLIDFEPLNIPERIELSLLNQQNGDPARAMAILSYVTKSEPKYAPGWDATARVALASGDIKTADEAIKTLETLPDQKELAKALRGAVLAKKGQFTEAAALDKAVAAANPASPLALYALTNLVVLDRQLKTLDDAAAFIGTLKPLTASSATLQGQCYLALDKTALATQSFDAAIAAHPTGQDAFLERARLYVEAHQNAQAIALLKDADKLQPADARARLMQAGINERMGSYPEARTLYEELLARDPQLDVAANNLAELIADHNSTDATALQEARKIAERFTPSSNPAYLDTLGWVYYREGKIQEAQTTLSRAAFLGGDKMPPQFHYHYGSVLLAAGKKEQAKSEFQQATPDGADYTGITEARNLQN